MLESGDNQHERSPLLQLHRSDGLRDLRHDTEGSESVIESHFSKEEQALSSSGVGERLDYNEYTTIDWLHDLVKDSYRIRLIRNGRGFRKRLYSYFDSCSGWIAVALMGTLTACVAFVVDICEATVSDWKYGYCTRNPFANRETCCKVQKPLTTAYFSREKTCEGWHQWTADDSHAFGICLGFALVFGIISATATYSTKRTLPICTPDLGEKPGDTKHGYSPSASGKSIFLAAGAGIGELKAILNGFVIPHFFDLKVLFVKAFGAIFAVATGMCLGKEGPFVHISGCVGYLIAHQFPKYRNNGRKMREILSAAVAAGLSVAFGAPLGGVLFSYEEISTHFPRKVLWRAFLCSLFAATILKTLNPNGTGRLVMFETNYGSTVNPAYYLIFVILGAAGGIWGGLFCKLNYMWSRWFRAFPIIKKNPIFEVSLVVLMTVCLQYPDPLTRNAGDKIIEQLLINCKSDSKRSVDSWVCSNEYGKNINGSYIGWLVYGCLVKLMLTIVTFGAKVPSGIIIPALGAGALFGRLIGYVFIRSISPGVFAMVGAGAFLAGVSRMTISLCVIMFELTGELEYVLPHMIAILVAKWVADALSAESVYDLAQSIMGHPFLDLDSMMKKVQRQDPAHVVGRLVPPKTTMDEITVRVALDGKVLREVLANKLDRLKSRGLMDAGLVLIDSNGLLQGYIGEAELSFGLEELGSIYTFPLVRLTGHSLEHLEPALDYPHEACCDEEESLSHDIDNGKDLVQKELDLSSYVDRTPLAMSEATPMEYAIEAFGKLGLRHLMITQEGTGRLIGVCLKKRMLGYLESLGG